MKIHNAVSIKEMIIYRPLKTIGSVTVSRAEVSRFSNRQKSSDGQIKKGMASATPSLFFKTTKQCIR